MRFSGGLGPGWHAVAVCLDYALPVQVLSRIWPGVEPQTRGTRDGGRPQACLPPAGLVRVCCSALVLAGPYLAEYGPGQRATATGANERRDAMRSMAATYDRPALDVATVGAAMGKGVEDLDGPQRPKRLARRVHPGPDECARPGSATGSTCWAEAGAAARSGGRYMPPTASVPTGASRNQRLAGRPGVEAGSAAWRRDGHPSARTSARRGTVGVFGPHARAEDWPMWRTMSDQQLLRFARRTT